MPLNYTSTTDYHATARLQGATPHKASLQRDIVTCGDQVDDGLAAQRARSDIVTERALRDTAMATPKGNKFSIVKCLRLFDVGDFRNWFISGCVSCTYLFTV